MLVCVQCGLDTDCGCCQCIPRQMLRDELVLKRALLEELSYEAKPEDLSQLQGMWSGATRAV